MGEKKKREKGSEREGYDEAMTLRNEKGNDDSKGDRMNDGMSIAYTYTLHVYTHVPRTGGSSARSVPLQRGEDGKLTQRNR